MSSSSVLLLTLAILAGAGSPREAAVAPLANAGRYAEALTQLRSVTQAAGIDSVTQARALAWQARVEVDRGDFAAAQATLLQAAARAEASKDTEARARVHFARGLLYERRQTRGLGGDPGFALARAEYEAALALADRAGLGWRALARFRVGVASERTGDDAAADRIYVKVLDEARRTGDVEAQAFAELHRANIAWRAGRLEGMRARQERVRALASKAGLLFLESTARINLADLQGGEAGARAALGVADALTPRLQSLPGLLDSAFVAALETAGELLRVREPQQARALLQRALAHAERSGQVSDRERLRRALAAPTDAGAP